MLSFSEWLKINETGTGTGSVAVFARQALPMIRRANLGPWGKEDPFFKKKKHKKKKINEGEPAVRIKKLPTLRLVDPESPHYRLDKDKKGTLYCPACGEPTRMKSMYFPKFDDEGNIVGGMCPRCAMRAYLSH